MGTGYLPDIVSFQKLPECYLTRIRTSNITSRTEKFSLRRVFWEDDIEIIVGMMMYD